MAAYCIQPWLRNVKQFYSSGTQLRYAITRSKVHLVPQRCLHSNRQILCSLKKNPHKLWRNGHPPHLCGLLTVRFNSSVPQPPESFPPGYIPEKPPIPLPDPDLTAAPELNALGEPTLESLGLGGWSPSGIFQQWLEFLHVSVDCPWWIAICISTVVVRTLIFPLMIKSRINTTNMQNHMPTIQRIQRRIQEAKMTGNHMETMRLYNELVGYTKRNDIKFSRIFLLPAVQIPIFLGVFWGLRAMANYPIESMKTGGVLWFPDLTACDPFYILPVLTSATLLLTFELGVDSMQAQSLSHVQKWMMRAMPIILLPFMMKFPAAMCVYWFASNTFSLFQALFLKIPAVRDFWKIPVPVQHDKSALTKKPFVQGFRDSWDEQKMIARMKDRERVEREAWEKSGKGPLIKTYKYNPLEQRNKVKL